MPTLALLLAFALGAYVFRRESKRKTSVSGAVWIPTIWMMRCASRGIDSWFGGGGVSEGGDSASYEQLFILFTALAAFYVVHKRKRKVKAVLRENFPLVVFFGYMLVSIAWSPVVPDSSKQYFRALGDLSMGLVLVTEANPLEAILTMIRRCMILLIPLSAVFSKYFPYIGRLQSQDDGLDMWIGVATHKNPLGQLLFLTGFGLFVLFFVTMRQRKLRWFQLPGKLPIEMLYLGMTLYLLNGGGAARSSTSVSVLFLCVGLFLLMEHFRSRPELVPKLLVIMICGVGAAQITADLVFGSSLREIMATVQGKDPTLAGRTQLWHDVLELAQKHPVQGAGFAGFWTPEVKYYMKMEKQHWWGPQQAHNGYIETYLQLGYIGVGLLVWVILGGFRGAVRRLEKDYDYNRTRIILILAAVIYNYSEAAFPRPTHLIWFAFIVVVINPAPLKQVLAATPKMEAAGAAAPA